MVYMGIKLISKCSCLTIIHIVLLVTPKATLKFCLLPFSSYIGLEGILNSRLNTCFAEEDVVWKHNEKYTV
jgi:hypothetical protein